MSITPIREPQPDTHFRPHMDAQERGEMRIAFDMAQTDQQKLDWMAKWGRRTVDYVWGRS